MNECLSKEVGEEEIKTAVFSLGAMKAPGPDGFSGVFFQFFWELIKADLFNLVQDFFRDGQLPKDLNNTNLVLIPQQKFCPESVDQFRPIGLSEAIALRMGVSIALKLHLRNVIFEAVRVEEPLALLFGFST
ncbi:hypothetical protein V6N12_070605 [Hibiscus sabdariffa]|uniref:Uncharacterized protein n=1 Tax=Hibiscus sabdariffa TaxID=183260 RepID=A0ABR2FHL5_9ROSI